MADLKPNASPQLMYNISVGSVKIVLSIYLTNMRTI